MTRPFDAVIWAAAFGIYAADRAVGAASEARARGAVGVDRLPATARRDPRVQPLRDRQLHRVPHRRRRSAGHLRVRHEGHRRAVAVDRIRSPHRDPGRRPQPLGAAAVPGRELRRAGGRRRRPLAAPTRAEHARPAPRGRGVPGGLLLLLGDLPLGRLRQGVGPDLPHPDVRAAVHPDRDCGAGDLEAPARGDGGARGGDARRDGAVPRRSPRPQPAVERSAGAVAPGDRRHLRPGARVRRALGPVPAAPQPVLPELGRPERSDPVRNRSRPREPRPDRPPFRSGAVRPVVRRPAQHRARGSERTDAARHGRTHACRARDGDHGADPGDEPPRRTRGRGGGHRRRAATPTAAEHVGATG